MIVRTNFFPAISLDLRDQGTQVKMMDNVIPSLFVRMERPPSSLVRCLFGEHSLRVCVSVTM